MRGIVALCTRHSDADIVQFVYIAVTIYRVYLYSHTFGLLRPMYTGSIEDQILCMTVCIEFCMCIMAHSWKKVQITLVSLI